MRTIQVRAGSVTLAGDLIVPARARGVVLFAHGTGSSRLSPRNQHVAQMLNRHALATLLLDLLTPAEEQVDAYSGHLRFDIKMLASRLADATDWLAKDARTMAMPIGYFGASTGAAAALIAAAARPQHIAAVVSRGGRPDLAAEALPRVKAPTLLIVGEYDDVVIELNRVALEGLRVEARLEIVPRATHLFEEPGALDRVAKLAGNWFARYLAR